MKRSELEKFLGKKVAITLFDNTIYSGELHKTGEETVKRDPDLYLPKNEYFVTYPETITTKSVIFRCSHVKNVREAIK